MRGGGGDKNEMKNVPLNRSDCVFMKCKLRLRLASPPAGYLSVYFLGLFCLFEICRGGFFFFFWSLSDVCSISFCCLWLLLFFSFCTLLIFSHELISLSSSPPPAQLQSGPDVKRKKKRRKSLTLMLDSKRL